MTDDQIWERASIGERVEMLRSWLRRDEVVIGEPIEQAPTLEQIERWKRIERAAKVVYEEWRRCNTPPAWWTRFHEKLGEALKP